MIFFLALLQLRKISQIRGDTLKSIGIRVLLIRTNGSNSFSICIRTVGRSWVVNHGGSRGPSPGRTGLL
jgi:hypothetical protein